MSASSSEAASSGSSRWRRAAGAVAGLLVFAFVALALGDAWGSVSDFDWRVRVPLLIAGLVVLVLHYVTSALGWVLILEALTGHPVSRLEFSAIWGRSILARYVPGNLLMIATRLMLGREAGVAPRLTFSASVYEQALSLAAAAVAGVALVAVYGGDGRDWLWLVGFVPLGLVLLHPRIFTRVTTPLLRRAGREPLERVLSLPALGRMISWYAVNAALLGVGSWLVVRSLTGAEAGGVIYVALAFLLSFVVSMLAFVFPSGLGVREGAFAIALARELPGGVAVAVSAATRLALTLVELLFVGTIVVAARRASAARAQRA